MIRWNELSCSFAFLLPLFFPVVRSPYASVSREKMASLSMHKMRTRKMNMRLRTTFTPRLLFYHLRERKTKGQVGNEHIDKLSTTSRCSHPHSYVNFTCYSTRRARWKMITKQALVNVLEISHWMELVLFPSLLFLFRFVWHSKQVENTTEEDKELVNAFPTTSCTLLYQRARFYCTPTSMARLEQWWY